MLIWLYQIIIIISVYPILGYHNNYLQKVVFNEFASFFVILSRF